MELTEARRNEIAWLLEASDFNRGRRGHSFCGGVRYDMDIAAEMLRTAKQCVKDADKLLGEAANKLVDRGTKEGFEIPTSKELKAFAESLVASSG